MSRKSSLAPKHRQTALYTIPSLWRDSLRMHSASGEVPSINRHYTCIYSLQTFDLSVQNSPSVAWLCLSLLFSFQNRKHLDSNSFLVSPLENSSHKKVRVQQVKSLILVLSVHLFFHPSPINIPRRENLFFLPKSFNLIRHTHYWSISGCCFQMIVNYVELNVTECLLLYFFKTVYGT